ncbi:hypothetical protein [Acidimangrovimonas sediminis]|uniref:hypothetical protein n=1 Tax=Acidimangrovimonas sediminis TaxID=2056283 RepID=UPI000C80A6CC|nr:hypothetical protein [Acidimangrovimonas sediminis]
MFPNQPLPARMFRAARSIVFALVALVTCFAAAPSQAEKGDRHLLPHSEPGLVVIVDDFGGRIQSRIDEIARYRQEGTRVEIRGGYCYSSCTMFLGLGNVCLDPGTEFGFHGPATLFRTPLAPEVHAHSATVMASFYPEPIRHWFLDVAQWRMSGVYRVAGSELIRLGMPRCSATS